MSIVKKIYRWVGRWNCRFLNNWWRLRDKLLPTKADSILFVAHPDDDALFFHSFIREHKPYVVLLFKGWSLRRLHDFRHAMHLYGVRWRAYETESERDFHYNPQLYAVTEAHVRECLKIGKFSLCVTHNAVGEYGHAAHQLTHKVVTACVGDSCTVLCPVSPEHIGEYPLAADVLAEKERIFKEIYTSELFVRDQYRVWFENEKLENQSNR